VEALVRWRHPLRGVLLPDAFVPIAERIGVISKLGYWVLLEACSQGRRWIDAGVPEVRISVNLSTLQFRSPLTLEADIAGALAQSGLPARLLELEVSESLLVDSLGEYREQLARLRKSGVQIAIGDFGSAYSSLDRLRKFPGDRIKIARSFIALLGATPGDAAIVKATIEIAREMGIPVIAGGVETEAQRNLLEQWGCAELQGFHFASPLDSDDATALLRLSAASPVA
jgi:EAL domain-containing protein (putative c-di-GMP-specific phosphodiesterase class I)